MRVRPVIERELRVQARAHGTFWLRLAAAGPTAAALGSILLAQRNTVLIGRTQPGPWLIATEGVLASWSAVNDLATRRFQLKPLRRKPT
jgi:hypothetical protein